MGDFISIARLDLGLVSSCLLNASFPWSFSPVSRARQWTSQQDWRSDVPWAAVPTSIATAAAGGSDLQMCLGGRGSRLDTEQFHGNNLQASRQDFLWRPALKSTSCLPQHQGLYAEEKEIRGLIFFFYLWVCFWSIEAISTLLIRSVHYAGLPFMKDVCDLPRQTPCSLSSIFTSLLSWADS